MNKHFFTLLFIVSSLYSVLAHGEDHCYAAATQNEAISPLLVKGNITVTAVPYYGNSHDEFSTDGSAMTPYKIKRAGSSESDLWRCSYTMQAKKEFSECPNPRGYNRSSNGGGLAYIAGDKPSPTCTPGTPGKSGFKITYYTFIVR